MSAQAQAIIADVKNHLQITWNDSATDQRIGNYIENGIAYLDDKRGAAADYTVSGYPRTLLFEYVRYARDDALDVFETNYQSLILAMRQQRQVSEYAQNSVSSEE